MTRIFACAIFMAICAAADAQDSGATTPLRPRFEVASVRECVPGGASSPSNSSPGRLDLNCWPLYKLIAEAYDSFAGGRVDPAKSPMPIPAEGAPAWVRSAQYTIEARADSPASGAMMRGPMMQALLEERFHLKVHWETREVTAYLMTIAKGGLKLKASTETSCKHFDPTDFTQNPNPTPGEPWCMVTSVRRKGPLLVLDVYGTTLDNLVKFLHPNNTPVMNATGLTGNYDVHLEWEADADGGANNNDPSPSVPLIAGIREQWGLRLDLGKGKHEALVIDHVERPGAN
jgi:uncharacterized protein (TIGR03435 family)